MKVTDFKSCRFTDPSSALQEKEAIALFGEIMGTPLYMSPEQAKGLDPDAPSDIYSMGATMFHALTGTAPFEGSSMYETLRDHIDAVPQLERIPEEFRASIEKALAKDPKQRFQKISELGTAIGGKATATKKKWWKF